MNKNTKIWLNYMAGAAISLFLIWCIYGQVIKQVKGIGADTLLHTGPVVYLCLCVSLMFINTSLEGCKWYMLVNSVAPLKYSQAFCSYLVGMAFSIITPNRIGEYPGRILYLGRSNTFRYINVSVLGIVSQLSAVYIFGLAGLISYNIVFPALIAKIALAACLLANALIAIVYWKFESWLPAFEKIKWLHQFSVYGRLLNRVTARKQITLLLISMTRFIIFTAQYLFLLRWMNVDIPLADGFWMVSLFFWVMAVIPSIALTELGIKGSVSLYLFHHYSHNDIGILAATVGIWLLNLIIPSVIGSVLLIRMKLLS